MFNRINAEQWARSDSDIIAENEKTSIFDDETHEFVSGLWYRSRGLRLSSMTTGKMLPALGSNKAPVYGTPIAPLVCIASLV
jgi:hypothetical protein